MGTAIDGEETVRQGEVDGREKKHIKAAEEGLRVLT